jgi:polyhydroxyalkanoate synthesis regulator protein
MPEIQSLHREYVKYPNRRLWGIKSLNGDSKRKGYVTLGDLGRFIARGGTIKATVRATQEDVTEQVLRDVWYQVVAAPTVDVMYAEIRKAYSQSELQQESPSFSPNFEV